MRERRYFLLHSQRKAMTKGPPRSPSDACCSACTNFNVSYLHEHTADKFRDYYMASFGIRLLNRGRQSAALSAALSEATQNQERAKQQLQAEVQRVQSEVEQQYVCGAQVGRPAQDLRGRLTSSIRGHVSSWNGGLPIQLARLPNSAFFFSGCIELESRIST